MSQLPTKQEQRDESPLLEQQTMCRLCSNMDEKLISFYSEEGISCQLVDKINTYLPFKVSIDDNLPLQSCINCTSKILTWHQFLIDAVDWDQKLRNVVPAQDKVEIEIDNESLDPLYCLEASTPEEKYVEKPPEKPSLKCQVCYKTHKDRSSYNKHMRGHKVQIRPNIINYHQGRTCEFCNKPKINLKIHQETCRRNPNNPFNEIINYENKSCKLCDASFDKLPELRKHIEEEHDVKKIRISRRKQVEINHSWFCDVCKKGYKRRCDMRKHRETAHFGKTKNVPGKRKRNSEFLKKCKVKNADGKLVYKCYVCKETFTKSSDLLNHRTTHTGIQSYYCYLCGKYFRLASKLKRHINQYHHKIKYYFSCELCDKRFFTNSALKKHLNIHSNVSPYSCDVCNKTFKQRATLFTHKKKYHTDKSDQNPLMCDTCGMSFRQKKYLTDHLQANHNSVFLPIKRENC